MSSSSWRLVSTSVGPKNFSGMELLSISYEAARIVPRETDRRSKVDMAAIRFSGNLVVDRFEPLTYTYEFYLYIILIY